MGVAGVIYYNTGTAIEIIIYRRVKHFRNILYSKTSTQKLNMKPPPDVDPEVRSG
jgi:hypothetical protein